MKHQSMIQYKNKRLTIKRFPWSYKNMLLQWNLEYYSLEVKSLNYFGVNTQIIEAREVKVFYIWFHF